MNVKIGQGDVYNLPEMEVKPKLPLEPGRILALAVGWGLAGLLVIGILTRRK